MKFKKIFFIRQDGQ